MLLQEKACLPQHSSEMGPAIDPMHETIEAPLELTATSVDDQTRRFRTHHVEDALDAVACRNRVAECQARRDETDDFAVGLASVAMDVVDRIPRACRRRIRCSK